MVKKLFNYFLDLRAQQRITTALAKGAAGMLSRKVNLKAPRSWEFSGFSQNGEDGILDVLRGKLRSEDHCFIEIGSSDGVQNNSSWLVMVGQYRGLMIEGDPFLAERGERLITPHSTGVEYLHMFVTRDNVARLEEKTPSINPDVFSLDIDGVDYYIADATLKCGIRPKIIVVEYNSVYGPERSMTVPYREGFSFADAHPTRLYYGVSIAAWKRFFADNGYKFVTVDSKGVNAFFVDPTHFDSDFLNEIQSVHYAENEFQRRKFGFSSERQFELIKDQEFVQI